MITTKAYVKQYKHLHLLKKHAQVFYLGRKYPLQVSSKGGKEILKITHSGPVLI